MSTRHLTKRILRELRQENVDIETPDDFYRDLHAACDFDHDPCPLGGKNNPAVQDGLDPVTVWGQRNFVNPPFKNNDKWIAKARAEDHHGRSSVMLLPIRSTTRYWQDLVMNHADVYFVVGKFKFKGYTNSFPVPMCLVVFDSAAQFNLPAAAGGYPLWSGRRTSRPTRSSTYGVAAKHPRRR